MGCFQQRDKNLFVFIMAFGPIHVARYKIEHVRGLDRMRICSDLCNFFGLLYDSDFLSGMLNGLGFIIGLGVDSNTPKV